MKTRKSSAFHTVVKAKAPQFVTAIVVFLVGGGYTAESQDLKAFDAQESYLVDGVPVILTQKIGQASVKLAPSFPVGQSAGSLTAANGASFSRTFAFPNGLSVYELQTNTGPVTAASSAAAIASLNSDTNLQFAYPVYVNPDTGNRLFVSDEIIVRLKTSSALLDTNLVRRFNLRPLNQDVVKLSDPRDYNPFKVCNALLASTDVIWAEPNFAGEANSYVSTPIVSVFIIPCLIPFNCPLPLLLINFGQSGGTNGGHSRVERLERQPGFRPRNLN